MSTTTQNKNLYGPPKVGGDALSYCSKCKIELSHTIVSMVDRQPYKVKCNTCQGMHRYKRQTLATLKSDRKPRAKKAPIVQISASELWKEKLQAHHEGEVIDYRANLTFEKDNVIKHKLFGLGIVESVKLDNKIVVFFSDGEKVLVHSR